MARTGSRRPTGSRNNSLQLKTTRADLVAVANSAGFEIQMVRINQGEWNDHSAVLAVGHDGVSHELANHFKGSRDTWEIALKQFAKVMAAA